MTPLLRIIIVGGIGILAFEAIAASAAGALGIGYAKFAVGSYAIYAAVGYLAVRSGPVFWGPVAGAAVAGVEAVAGWRLAAIVGPDIVRLGLDEARQGRSWIVLALVLIAVGAMLGLLGGLLSEWQKRRGLRSAPAQPDRRSA